MKTKMKIWTRVLLVCMTMSLFCVNAHAEAKKKATDKKTSPLKKVRTDAERMKYDILELNFLLTNGKPR